SLNKMQHVDAQGFLYYIEGGSGNVMRYDPDADEAAAIGQFSLAKHLPGVTWAGDQPPQHRAVRLLETLGQAKAIGYMAWCDAVVELDTTNGEIRVIGRLDPTVTELPRRGGPAVRGMAISDTTFFAITNLSGGGQPMHSRFVTLDLAT